MARRWLRYIPNGVHLDEAEFRSRHRIVLLGYAAVALVAVLHGTATAVLDDDPAFAHLAIELVALAVPAALIPLPRSRIGAQLVTCTGILLSCGMLVHSTGGLIEAHFSYFVILPLIALYNDWRPFAYSAAYVAATHGVVGTLWPQAMYDHPAAIASPVLWGLIHAGFILALCGVMLVHWNFSDRRRIELAAALDDLHRTQDRLLESQKLESVGSLAAGVAHEINTPIQFVGDNLEYLSSTATDLERFLQAWLHYRRSVDDPVTATATATAALESLDGIAEEIDVEFAVQEMPAAAAQSLDGVRRVADIVRAMRGFSHSTNEVVASDLNQLIRDTSVVSSSAWRSVAELTLDLHEELPPVPVPPGSFNQALLNLIVNAAHAIGEQPDGGPSGQIVVRTRPAAGDRVAISVADNGCGIPESIRSRIYEQFFTTKDVGEGAGQGLAIVERLVAGLGGSIELESEVGVGTTFTLSLPVPAAAGERTVADDLAGLSV